MQEFTEDLAHRSQVLAGHLNAFRVRNMLHDKVLEVIPLPLFISFANLHEIKFLMQLDIYPKT